ncbi:MAG: glycosyltransferase [Solirubrobacteraceae bacterium]
MTLPPRAVWLDAQGAQNREHFDRGIPRYITDQLRAVVELAPEIVRSVALNPALPLSGNLNWLLGSELLSWSGSRPATPLPAIYHVTSPFELSRSLDDVWPAWARTSDVKTVVTLFDLIPMVFAEHYLRDPRMVARYRARAELVRRADHVLAISRTTADDAVELLGVDPQAITVIDAGVANNFTASNGSGEEARRIVQRRFPHLRRGFMFYVAGIEFRKNIARLIRAQGLTTPAFRDAHQLVITCRMRAVDEEHLRREMAEANLREGDVVLTNYISDADLAALYRTCELFVFASFYEGSGLPILEAMACGAPVAAANTATTPEILGDLEATFDPYDPADIAGVLQSTLADTALMQRLIKRSAERVRHYTWRRVAERTVEGYERVLAHGRRRHTRRRPRVVVFSPWPPDRSGIATYNRRLLEELGRLVDVDVVVDRAVSREARSPCPGVSLVSCAEVPMSEALCGYDRRMYCMGNSHFHGAIFEALCQRPGVVVAHDVRLTGFYGWYAGTQRPHDAAGWLGQRIAGLYPAPVGAMFLSRPPSPEEQAALGIYMTQEIQQHAEQLVVHSRFAADILRLDRALPHDQRPATSVLPLACPTVTDAERPAPSTTAPMIVSFGVVSSVKSPDVLIEAFADLAADRPGARLVFAGGADEEEFERWRKVAAGVGIDDRVEFRGHVEEEAWKQLLQQADIAVQLRRVSNGEASAAVTECLSAGLPCVVSDDGWAAELPDDAVVKVAPDLNASALAVSITRIIDDPDGAALVSEAAKDYARRNSFAEVARRYVEILELDRG